MKTLIAKSMARIRVEREVEEARTLSVAAESLKELAKRELSSSQAIVHELFLHGQEFHERQFGSSVPEILDRGALAIPEPQVTSVGLEPEGIAFAQTPLDGLDRRSDPIDGDVDESFGAPGRDGLEINASPVAAEEIKEEDLMNDLAELRHSLENIRGSRGTQEKSPSVVPPPIAPVEGDSGPQSLPPEPETQYSRTETVPAAWPEMDPGPTTSEQVPLISPQETYSGRFSLVFTPCPDAEMLGHFWGVLDGLLGVGKVIDARPVNGGAEFEFTVDLGEEALVVDELRGSIPNAELVALGDESLRVNWTPN